MFQDVNFRPLWSLDPSVKYLNHGSYGACPVAVLQKQELLRQELEREPTAFFGPTFDSRLNTCREALATFVGADAQDIVFVPNASTGVNAVLRSLRFEPGDELLATNVTYCRKALDFVAARSGARTVIAELPFPLRNDGEIVTAVLSNVSSRTKLALLDHVTSSTGVITPVEPLVQELRNKGIDVLVDGAHAPGMIPLSLANLGAAYYTGNAHKWLCAPKGAAFLHVRRDRHSRLHPTVISHGFGGGLHAEFDWTGTCDPTPWLCIPEVIRYLDGLVTGGWKEIMSRNHDLAVAARSHLLKVLGTELSCPDSMIGSMAAVLLPVAEEGSIASCMDVDQLSALFRQRGISAWFSLQSPPRVRISAQLYNDIEEFETLGNLICDVFWR